MTTQTKARFSFKKFWLEIREIFSRERNRAELGDAVSDIGRDFSMIGQVISYLVFTMLISAILAMFTAYVLAYPNGLAGMLADMARQSGMTLQEFIPAFGFSMVLINSFAIFFIYSVANWSRWQVEQDDDQTYSLDDLAGMIIELEEKLDDHIRKAE